MTTLTVRSVATGNVLGTVELAAGMLVFSSPLVERMIRSGQRDRTDAELFARWSAGWSNGYIEVMPVPGPAS